MSLDDINGSKRATSFSRRFAPQDLGIAARRSRDAMDRMERTTSPATLAGMEAFFFCCCLTFYR